jgi:hypothetical protein
MIRQRESQHNPKKTQIFIYTEGQTEYNYFEQIKKDLTGKRSISVNNCSINKKLPIEFVRYAKNNLLSRGKSLNKKDRVFCVFDMDTVKSEDINIALSKMPTYMQLIVSNPDFELWFLLHYKYCKAPLNNREPIEKLKEYEPDYQKPHVDKIYNSLKKNEKFAIINARLLRQKQTEEGHYLFSKDANPCTNVDEAISYILDHCKS